MKKIINLQSVTLAALLVSLASLVYSNHQANEKNSELTQQVSALNKHLSQLHVSTKTIEQRLIELETKLEPKFQGLVARN